MARPGPAFPSTTIRTPIAVEGWLQNAIKGERLEYWRGNLARAVAGYDGGAARDRRAVDDLARHMRELEADGAVVLVQKRHGYGDYSYLAVKI